MNVPPLNSLKSFESAARHLSFKKAAEELHVTPSVVSQHIKKLERYYQITLFIRKTRAVRLTAKGQDVLALISPAFDQLRQTDAKLREGRMSDKLKISSAPIFATQFLLPKIKNDQKVYDTLTDIVVDASEEKIAFTDQEPNLMAIRYSPSVHASEDHMVITRLFRERVIPVCSPDYMDSVARPTSPGQLPQYRLIHTKKRYPNKMV